MYSRWRKTDDRRAFIRYEHIASTDDTDRPTIAVIGERDPPEGNSPRGCAWTLSLTADGETVRELRDGDFPPSSDMTAPASNKDGAIAALSWWVRTTPAPSLDTERERAETTGAYPHLHAY